MFPCLSHSVSPCLCLFLKSKNSKQRKAGEVQEGTVQRGEGKGKGEEKQGTGERNRTEQGKGQGKGTGKESSSLLVV